MILESYQIYSVEGDGVYLSVSETPERKEVIILIQRVGDGIQTIRLDEKAWYELCELKYSIALKGKEDEE